jgi:acetyl-CoA acetyltransferase
MSATGVTTGFYTPAVPELSGRASIVGVGDSDYGEDYRASREQTPEYVPPDPQTLCRTAFDRALADAGLRAQDVDGLSLSFLYAHIDVPTMAKALEVEPRLARIEQIAVMYDVVPGAAKDLVNHECDTIALVYCAASRSTGQIYGGTSHLTGPQSYHYYHPWGWSSQAAHWALMFQQYANVFGSSEEDLGSVALTLRRHAGRNPNAIMRQPLTLDEYMNSRYVVRPLHLFDLCLVNDGAVCLIMQRDDMARDRPHVPVRAAGWAHAKISTSSQKMYYMVKERLRPQYDVARKLAFEMADLTTSDVGHFQGYDASSFHLIDQLEGYGFVEPGDGLEFCKAGETDLGGRLPMNTSGGMLSEAYMHGWNHVAEAVRQLRHEAGERQIRDLQVSLFSMADTESAHPLILQRGSR